MNDLVHKAGYNRPGTRNALVVDTVPELISAIRSHFLPGKPPTRFRNGTILGPIRATRGKRSWSFVLSGIAHKSGFVSWLALQREAAAAIRAEWPDSHGTFCDFGTETIQHGGREIAVTNVKEQVW